MKRYRDIFKEAFFINLITLAVVALFYFCIPVLFDTLFSGKKDDIWLLNTLQSVRNNSEFPKEAGNVLICDISGIGTRDSIVSVLETLRSYEPSVIGCDIIFPQISLTDSVADAALARAAESTPSMVMAARPVYDAAGNITAIEKSFFGGNKHGDVTIFPDGKHILQADGVPYMNFSSLVARIAKGEEVEYPNGKYVINYANRYIPVRKIDEIAVEDVKGKIVLMGDIMDLRDYIDLKFSLSDHNYYDKFLTTNRVPGILVHAYAISAILEEDWIRIIPEWISLLVGFMAAFGLSFLNRFWIEKGWKKAYLTILKYILMGCVIWVCYPLYTNLNIIFNPFYFAIAAAMYDYSCALLDIINTVYRKMVKRVKRCN